MHNKKTDMNRVSDGFTLIELMIAMAIMAILAAIAVPSYQEFILKARRSEGQSALLDIAARQEQFFLDNHRYTNDISDLGRGTKTTVLSKEGYYSVSAACGLVAGGSCQNGYVLTATALGGQVKDGDLKIDSVGRKTGKW